MDVRYIQKAVERRVMAYLPSLGPWSDAALNWSLARHAADDCQL